MNATVRSFPRRYPVWTGVLVLSGLLMLLLALFDWNWLRPALERYISQKTQRTFLTQTAKTPAGILARTSSMAWRRAAPSSAQPKLESSGAQCAWLS